MTASGILGAFFMGVVCGGFVLVVGGGWLPALLILLAPVTFIGVLDLLGLWSSDVRGRD